MSIHYEHITIRRLFPPDDPLAVSVARLCILIEDFNTEARGAATAAIPSLDELSPEWRRLYFLRNSIRTLHEIRRVIDGISNNSDFKKSLKIQTKQVKFQFKKYSKALKKQEALLKDVRDDIAGGHVLQKAVKDGLDNLDPFEEGLLQVGSNFKNTHFRFAHKIVAASLFSRMEVTNAENQDQRLTEFLNKVNDAITSALGLTGIINYIYFKGWKLAL